VTETLPPPAGDAATETGAPALPPLTARVRADVLQRSQNRFSAVVGVSVVICDRTGAAAVSPIWASAYLKLLSESAPGRALIDAALAQCCAAPSPLLIPFSAESGLSVYGAPIHLNGERIGTIVIGARPPAALDLAVVAAVARRCGMDAEPLCAAAREMKAWAAARRQAVFSFVDFLADMIATLYAQSHELTTHIENLRTIHELTQLLSGTRDLQEILNVTARRVDEALRVKACAIRLLDEDTGELVIRAVHNLSQDYLNKGRVLLSDNPIDRAAFDGEAVYIEDARTDSRIRFRESAIAEGIVSGLCVGMTYRGKTLGVLRVYTGQHRAFSVNEAQLLRSIGAQAAAAITHARLNEESTRQAAVSAQMHRAGQIQRRMIPAEPPASSLLDFGMVYEPTLDVGGDFFDFLELGGGRLGIAIADVAGKGIPAALLMASVRSTLRAHARTVEAADESMMLINRQLCHDTEVHEFVTLFYGVLNRAATRLDYCNAGHEAPVRLRGEAFTPLDRGGKPIGIWPGEAYDKGTIDLSPGDTLVFATDGTIEAINFADEPMGRPRFRESMLRYRHLPAQQMAQQLLWDVRRFVGLAEQSDDIAIVVVKRR